MADRYHSVPAPLYVKRPYISFYFLHRMTFNMQLNTIQSSIYEIRGHQVMLDFDLAILYGVQTKVLNQAVKRNASRFPADFMIHLTKAEWKKLKDDDADVGDNWSQSVTGSQRHRVSVSTPYAFTEQGVAMLSSVLRSPKAIKVNIAIMRTFVFMRQYALSHKDLTAKLQAMELKYDIHFKDIFEAINFLLTKDKLITSQRKRRPIGFQKD